MGFCVHDGSWLLWSSVLVLDIAYISIFDTSNIYTFVYRILSSMFSPSIPCHPRLFFAILNEIFHAHLSTFVYRIYRACFPLHPPSSPCVFFCRNWTKSSMYIHAFVSKHSICRHIGLSIVRYTEMSIFRYIESILYFDIPGYRHSDTSKFGIT